MTKPPAPDIHLARPMPPGAIASLLAQLCDRLDGIESRLADCRKDRLQNAVSIACRELDEASQQVWQLVHEVDALGEAAHEVMALEAPP